MADREGTASIVCCMLSDNIRTIREANNGWIIRIQLNQSADKNSVKYLLPSIFEENIIKSIKKGKLHEHTRNIQHNLLEQRNRILSTLQPAPICLGIPQLKPPLCYFSEPYSVVLDHSAWSALQRKCCILVFNPHTGYRVDSV